MVTLNISAGAIFTIGLVTGLILGAIGLVIAAFVYTRKSR